MSKMDDSTEEEPQPIHWKIDRRGRAWTAEEFEARAARLLGLDLEISKGKLFHREETRLLILRMLLENVGTDTAVKLGDLGRWKESIAAAERARGREA